jgi:hypothetical protein
VQYAAPGLPRAPEYSGITTSKRGNSVPLEGWNMGWGWIRIGIFTTAFLTGLMVVGPLGTSASSKPSDILRLNESVGGSLIVACNGGDVAIKHVGGEPGAVQLECEKGKIVVVRNRHERIRPLPVTEARVRHSRFD